QRHDRRGQHRHDDDQDGQVRVEAHESGSSSRITSSSTDRYSSRIRTTTASPRAVVAIPTTMAVRISTCGRGLEKTPPRSPGVRIGAVPPSILFIEMYSRNTAAWNTFSPIIRLIRLPQLMIAYSP